MTIVTEFKQFLADNKLNDEQSRQMFAMFKKSLADNQNANQDSDDTTDEDDADTETASGEEESADVEEDSTTEKPDIRAIVQEELSKALAELRKGKTPPKPTKKPKEKEKPQDFTFEFGAL